MKMFTRRTIDEACSPSEKADTIKGWRRYRYAAMAATRQAAAPPILSKVLNRDRNLCMTALFPPYAGRGRRVTGGRDSNELRVRCELPLDDLVDLRDRRVLDAAREGEGEQREVDGVTDDRQPVEHVASHLPTV